MYFKPRKMHDTKNPTVWKSRSKNMHHFFTHLQLPAVVLHEHFVGEEDGLLQAHSVQRPLQAV